MLNQDNITTADCINVLPPPDRRCQDPAFALNNPGICPPQTYLIIKPGTAVACVLGSIQFRAFTVDASGETDVSAETLFSSLDLNLAIIGATSGNATGIAAGTATVQATYQGMLATAEFNVLAGTNCCSSYSNAFLILIDVTKSMSLGFGEGYKTRLNVGIAAAQTLIGKINSAKDTVGVATFTDTTYTMLTPISSDTTGALASLSSATQTQLTTGFSDAITDAIAELAATGADQQILVLISDGEDEDTGETAAANDPLVTANQFKQTGGIVMCFGCRASDINNGFAFLSQMLTGGFFVNALPANVADALTSFTGLMGYLCAGDCTSMGDVVQGQGMLDFNSFQNWIVSGGNVDLIGNGLFDLLPGNGLYVDLGGTNPPHAGLMETRNTFPVVAGQVYRLTLTLAGNQVDPDDGATVQATLVGTLGTTILDNVVVSDYTSGFRQYSFSFTAQANDNVRIEIQETDLTAGSGIVTPPTPPQGWLELIQGTPLIGGVTYTGTGSPEGVITATPGQTYWDSGPNQAFWVKNTGTGNTGWQCIIILGAPYGPD